MLGPALYAGLRRGLARGGNCPTDRWTIALGPEHRAPGRQGPGHPALGCRGRTRARLEPAGTGDPDRHPTLRPTRPGGHEFRTRAATGEFGPRPAGPQG